LATPFWHGMLFNQDKAREPCHNPEHQETQDMKDLHGQ
jgi:hypothetical protein